MMTDEQKALAEQLNALQKKNLEEGKAEIDAVLERRGLMLDGIPQYVQSNGIWATKIAIFVTLAKEDA